MLFSSCSAAFDVGSAVKQYLYSVKLTEYHYVPCSILGAEDISMGETLL